MWDCRFGRRKALWVIASVLSWRWKEVVPTGAFDRKIGCRWISFRSQNHCRRRQLPITEQFSFKASSRLLNKFCEFIISIITDVRRGAGIWREGRGPKNFFQNSTRNSQGHCWSLRKKAIRSCSNIKDKWFYQTYSPRLHRTIMSVFMCTLWS